MLTIAFCQDSPRARELRHQHFAPHMQHLRAVMHGIRFAAPLATADGAAISDDDRLVASVFAIEAVSVTAASDLMAADPYTSQDVWRCVTLFGVSDASGAWLTTPATRPAERLYALLATGGADAPAFASDDALFCARLNLVTTLGDASQCRDWHSIAIFAADSLEAAQLQAAGYRANSSDAHLDHVWAVPLAVGSWPGRSNL